MSVRLRWNVVRKVLLYGIGLLMMGGLILLLGGCGGAETPETPTAEEPSVTDIVIEEEEVAPESEDAPGSETGAAALEPEERTGMYTSPPEMLIDPNKVYVATLETEKGDIVVELFADKAPETVNSFVFLARDGYYDNTTFHRVIEDFMAQAGDPSGTGMGGPGYTFADEFHPDLRHDGPGVLSMANAGPGTNGSQFFITYDATPWLDGKHSVFGKVVEGMDVVQLLNPRDPQTATGPGDEIKTIRIEEAEKSLLPEPTPVVLTEPGAVPMPDDPMQRVGMYEHPPEMVIDPETSYVATIKTEKGDLVVELFAGQAPRTVNNFIFLAREGYYDNTTFHRVIEDFMAQAGDPSGTGRGGPGYTFADEFHPDLTHDGPGVLSMANAGANTNGSQFFITFAETPWLDGQHSVFGKVVEGLDVLEKISLRDPQTAQAPGDVIETIVIEEGAAGSSSSSSSESEEEPEEAMNPGLVENDALAVPSVTESFAGLEGEPFVSGETSVAYPGADGVRWFPSLGDKDAPVIVMEFSEVGCGHCRVYNSNSFPKILEEHVKTGQARYVGHLMAFNRPQSREYLGAAMCAMEQGQYFAYEHAVYGSGDLALTASAEEIDLDMAAFNACIEEGRYAEAVDDASNHAFQMGVNATPTFFVNGEMVQGNNPARISQLILEALPEE